MPKVTLMPDETRPPRPVVSPSSPARSNRPAEQQNKQLSPRDGFQSSVSTAAMDGGVLVAGLESAASTLQSAMVGSENYTDAEVMLRVKAGDQSAFDFLVQKYRRPIINFMYRMAHNTAAAEDLAQEVFLRVYRSRSSYEASAKFTTWLYRIATNLGMNYSRDTRHERPENIMNLDAPDEETGQAPDLADKTPSVEEEIMRRERLRAIRQKVEA